MARPAKTANASPPPACLQASASPVPALADTTLLNVSYDPTRELYKAYQRGLRRRLEGRRPARPSPSSSRMAAPASRPAP